MCAPSSRLSATRMPAIRYRLARETCEMRHALTVCRTNCISNSEYSSPLRPRISITLGNARRVASSTVNPLIPRLYTCGSSRSSSRRLGTLSQSCLMFFVSVMQQLYLTEASETTINCLQNKHFSKSAFQQVSFLPLVPRLAAHEAPLPVEVGFEARGADTGRLPEVLKC